MLLCVFWVSRPVMTVLLALSARLISVAATVIAIALFDIDGVQNVYVGHIV